MQHYHCHIANIISCIPLLLICLLCCIYLVALSFLARLLIFSYALEFTFFEFFVLLSFSEMSLRLWIFLCIWRLNYGLIIFSDVHALTNIAWLPAFSADRKLGCTLCMYGYRCKHHDDGGGGGGYALAFAIGFPTRNPHCRSTNIGVIILLAPMFL